MTLSQNNQKSAVNSYNEWGLLEEVIVGRIDHSTFAANHISTRSVVPEAMLKQLKKIGSQPMPTELLTLAQQQLDEFIAILTGEGVTVKRPEIYNHSREYQTTDWYSRGLSTACPRDGILIIGDEIIETPMAWRSRYFEMMPYRGLLRDYFEQGARWTSAPKPQLLDSLYDENYTVPSKNEAMRYVVNESEIVFDAADFIRCGKDIFCQVSNVTNQIGIEWLKRHLGSQYRIHTLNTSHWRHPMHIDASFVPLAAGQLLINPDDIDVNELPDFVHQWDLIIAPQPVKTSKTKYHHYNMCSEWLSANVLSLDEKRVIVEKKQTPLIKLLTQQGFQVIVCDFEHYSPFGGAFHCATLDIKRQSILESYFDI